MTAPQSAKSA